jgi:hypothetical protein
MYVLVGCPECNALSALCDRSQGMGHWTEVATHEHSKIAAMQGVMPRSSGGYKVCTG